MNFRLARTPGRARWSVAGVVICFLFLPFTALAAPATQPSAITITLWPQGVPNAPVNPGPERDDPTGRVWNVSDPQLLAYLPPRDGRPPCMAIVFAPSGGYTHLTRLVGADGMVQEFLPRGVAIISVKYRIRPASPDVERDAMADISRAIQIVRLNAAVWNIDSHRIGLLGASAGANAVLNIVSHGKSPDLASLDPLDRLSPRPDFVAMLSPWPDKHDISTYPIGKDAPPAFIASARDDKTAPYRFAQAIDAAYAKAGVPHQFWPIDKGGHGAFGLGGTGEGSHWVERFLPWLGSLGIKV